jgi:2-keto-4-pentenoate hydratase/2-oxohepta-3-ene-1,7-dioic acid hydratase in catechol pathway
VKLCRFGEQRLGLIEGSSVRDVTAALDALPSYRYPLPRHDVMIANMGAIAARVCEIAARSPILPLDGLKLLSPVANPGKIVAAPVNYRRHLDEVKGNPELHAGNPAHTASIQSIGLFLKATSSLTGPGEGVTLRHLERRNDHEVELALVIGREARSVPARDALEYVAGYSIGLDITIRGAEDRSFRKSPDSYTVLGPWLVTPDEIPDPGALDLSLSVNGEIRQSSNTRQMILGVAELIEFASSFYTLYPGDVMITGTPEGVSPIYPGDTIVARIAHIGEMEVKVGQASACPSETT